MAKAEPAANQDVSRARSAVPTIQPALAFGGIAIAYASLFLAAGAPTPLLVRLQHVWGFPESLLTIAFAAYAIGYLGALLLVGSLSDYLGRRPVLIAALAVEFLSMLMFLFAPGIEWVIAARLVQGAATGAATAAFAAVLIELAPANRKEMGAVLGGVAPAAGLGLGALATGVAIQFTAAPNEIVFTCLALIMAAGVVVVGLTPETTARRPGALGSMRPHLSVPPAARTTFAAIVPMQIAAWMLAGLYLGLMPSIIRGMLGIDSGLLNGATAFVEPAAAAVAAFVFGRLEARRTTRIGTRFLLVGSVVIAVGIAAPGLAMIWIGGVIAGIGFGAVFSGSLRAIGPLALPHERAGLFAAFFAVAYLAFGIPVLIAGQFVDRVGLAPTMVAYGVVLVAWATIGAFTGSRLAEAPAVV